jgi:hypothetical protein
MEVRLEMLDSAERPSMMTPDWVAWVSFAYEIRLPKL